MARLIFIFETENDAMEKHQLNETLQQLTEQLNQLTRFAEDQTAQQKVNTFKNQLLKAFPQAFPSHKFRGRIEQVIIEINNLYQNRIITPNETFTILINVYSNPKYGFTLSDMQQLNDSIQIHFQEATIRFESFLSESFHEEEILLMLEFTP